MKYPDTKAIVSGYFKPIDETRCLVCGIELRRAESTCGEKCFATMCRIQGMFTLEDCEKMIEAAMREDDPRLIVRDC